MDYKKIFLSLMLFALLFIFGCTSQPSNEADAVMFKDPNCGCCVGHASYLNGNGISVLKNNISEMDLIKEQYQIPKNMQSCHTLIISDYFVEGHVPIEAINKLVEEKPSIDGIALPAMPSGSPGMPGPKDENWTIYSIKDGEIVGTFIII